MSESESVKSLSRVRLCVTPWTVARQAPLSMGFSRQEYWGGLPCLPPGDLPHLGIEPRSPALQTGKPHKASVLGISLGEGLASCQGRKRAVVAAFLLSH